MTITRKLTSKAKRPGFESRQHSTTCSTIREPGFDSRSKDCSDYNRLWLELWWVTRRESRTENFGTSSYFSKFERCSHLEPDHFVFHSMKPLAAIENLKG